MGAQKALAIIKESKNPAISADGILAKKPTEAQLKRNIPNDVQRNIYINAFSSLEYRNLNFISVMPMLLSYSMEMANYFILNAEAGDERVSIRRGDEVINPLLVQANRHLQNAIKLSELLGLDIKSRQKLENGAMPQKASKKKDEFGSV